MFNTVFNEEVQLKFSSNCQYASYKSELILNENFDSKRGVKDSLYFPHGILASIQGQGLNSPISVL